MDIWFIADTHFYHNNILIYEKRPFSCVEEMNEIIIDNWNKLIKPQDEVWHLGDVALCNSEKLEEVMKRLNGKKYLKLGNHDKGNSVTKWLRLGFEDVFKENQVRRFHKDMGYVLLSHAPDENTSKNIHGHVHSNIQELDQSRYKCVSVECTDYKPIHIDEIVKWYNQGC